MRGTCWVCRDDLPEWDTAPREASDEDKRWCVSCHNLVKGLGVLSALKIANLLREVCRQRDDAYEALIPMEDEDGD